MLNEEYLPNSHRSKEANNIEKEKEQQKRTEKVVSGTVKQQKKTGLKKAMNNFMPGSFDSVRSDVLIPSIRKALMDILCEGIKIMFGESTSDRSSRSTAERINYRKYYRDDDRETRRPRASTSRYDFDDIIFDNRGDAEAVLDRMYELIDHFDVVSVADLFDMAGISCDYTANRYGWTDLSRAKVVRVKDGYIIDLPNATSL